MKPSENPREPNAPSSVIWLASFVNGLLPSVASSASVINDNLNGVTRAEKRESLKIL